MIQVPVDESAAPKKRLDRFLSGLLAIEKKAVAKHMSANLDQKHTVLI
jgi:hypothetical protein